MEGVTRHVQDRYGLSRADAAKRTCAVNDLSKKYPRISPFYLELLYDWLVDMTDEERTAAVNDDTDEPRPQVGEIVGGVELIKGA